jgi:hypothetical protein
MPSLDPISAIAAAGYRNVIRLLGPFGATMERLHFICPKTGQDIDVGIDSELDTLLRIRSNHVLARCPVCGERHKWEVGEARLLLQAA